MRTHAAAHIQHAQFPAAAQLFQFLNNERHQDLAVCRVGVVPFMFASLMFCT
jgi:hypothetical protein